MEERKKNEQVTNRYLYAMRVGQCESQSNGNSLLVMKFILRFVKCHGADVMEQKMTHTHNIQSNINANCFGRRDMGFRQLYVYIVSTKIINMGGCICLKPLATIERYCFLFTLFRSIKI